MEREEESFVGALVGREREHILAVEGDGALGDRVGRIACQDSGERRFAGSVAPHERVYLAFADAEVEALEYFFAAHGGV